MPTDTVTVSEVFKKMNLRQWNEFLDMKFAHETLTKSDVGYIVFDKDLSSSDKVYLIGRIISWCEQNV